MSTKLPRNANGRFFKGGGAYPNGRPSCNAAHCTELVRGPNYCERHRSQLQQYGRILEHTKFDRRAAIIVGRIAKIPLGIAAEDGYAIVDRADAWVDRYNWHRVKQGYAYTNLPCWERKQRTHVGMHVLIMDSADTGLEVDHRDQNKLNNRRKNLRIVTRSINSHNRGPQANNTSGVKGVYWANWVNKWRVVVMLKGKRINGGYFADIGEAAKARKRLDEEHGLCA